ncbi:hypothetical protein F4859DRAFT_516052 [Xylaria cf. heliscus]|nr:hypothetical protein F4859DRAFT_516052 [Xylaria cf. heliscus]
MKATAMLHAALLGLQASVSTQLSIPRDTATISKYPTRTVANVSLVDTALVREAAAFARQHSNDEVWNHIMRGWLYGVIAISHNSTLRATVDLETHAVAALLHDLGWDQTPHSPVVSTDKRFEVDGAIAAREFIRQHASSWDEHRVQLVWDSIALHTQKDIFLYKENTVMVTGAGIYMDFTGPTTGVTQKEYNAVEAVYPKPNFLPAVNETFIWLCATKATTTYDNFMQPWGDNYVHGYNSTGHRVFDTLF